MFMTDDVLSKLILLLSTNNLHESSSVKPSSYF